MDESTAELKARKASLAVELSEIRRELARRKNIPLTTEALKENRAYAFNANSPMNMVVKSCVDSLTRYGFCVVDEVIPSDQTEKLRGEAEQAEINVKKTEKAILEVMRARGSVDDLMGQDGIELRPVRRVGYPPKMVNDIVWLPEYAKHLAHPAITEIARTLLDEHLKIAQLHLRPIAATAGDGTLGGFGRPEHRGRADTREWHTDWPHDLSAYGGDDPQQNIGCIRQPFPDVAMGLTMIWYLTDVDEDSGATFVVPGSHRDTRNPRGPEDGISVTSPIPGDMQITAKAGSVFVQDSRCWHSSPMHNTSAHKRVAIVNRWSPWWISVDDYGPGGSFNTACRPLSQKEFDALPTELQPLMRHLCPTEKDTLQQPVLDRAQAAHKQNHWGYQQLEEHPDTVAKLNSHIRVDIKL
jgi:ectoine hydroxylase-related dioxygenase (phytanoyl-CoA dioxygenase family)